MPRLFDQTEPRVTQCTIRWKPIMKPVVTQLVSRNLAICVHWQQLLVHSGTLLYLKTSMASQMYKVTHNFHP
jgi:hypothetical protein